MLKKITCFFITTTFLLSLTVTAFANETNNTKKIFMDSFQKTSTILNDQLETAVKNGKLNTTIKNNFSNPREMDFVFNVKSGTDSFYNENVENIDNVEVKVNLQYDLANFKISGKMQVKDITNNTVDKLEVFLSPDVSGYGFNEHFYYNENENYVVKKNLEDINIEDLSEVSKKIEDIITKNIDKGEFISNGNNNYTLKLSNELVNKTINEIAFEMKNDGKFIEVLKISPYYENSTSSEIIEEIDYMVQDLLDANLKITYDIGINDKGLINKQRIKMFIEDDYSITIFTELAGEEYLLDKMKMKISISEPGYKDEIIFESSGNSVSENGIKMFKAAISFNSNYTQDTLTELISFDYLYNENITKDNFTFSFVSDDKNSGSSIIIKNLVGSLNFDADTGNISYIIENGKIDKFDYSENIIFDMSFKIKGISSDQIKLPKNAIKVE